MPHTETLSIVMTSQADQLMVLSNDMDGSMSTQWTGIHLMVLYEPQTIVPGID
ncbi:hypothetical protein [Thalassoglobus sp.]|uniref:hypothetical protein n=1 Tax=Thalassoglobus sp. TaxID=2795869 RepID=UPI003AA7E431